MSLYIKLALTLIILGIYFSIVPQLISARDYLLPVIGTMITFLMPIGLYYIFKGGKE